MKAVEYESSIREVIDLCFNLDFNLQLALSVLVRPRDLLLNTTQHSLAARAPEGDTTDRRRDNKSAVRSWEEQTTAS